MLEGKKKVVWCLFAGAAAKPLPQTTFANHFGGYVQCASLWKMPRGNQDPLHCPTCCRYGWCRNKAIYSNLAKQQPIPGMEPANVISVWIPGLGGGGHYLGNWQTLSWEIRTYMKDKRILGSNCSEWQQLSIFSGRKETSSGPAIWDFAPSACKTYALPLSHSFHHLLYHMWTLMVPGRAFQSGMLQCSHRRFPLGPQASETVLRQTNGTASSALSVLPSKGFPTCQAQKGHSKTQNPRSFEVKMAGDRTWDLLL